MNSGSNKRARAASVRVVPCRRRRAAARIAAFAWGGGGGGCLGHRIRRGRGGNGRGCGGQRIGEVAVALVVVICGLCALVGACAGAVSLRFEGYFDDLFGDGSFGKDGSQSWWGGLGIANACSQ